MKSEMILQYGSYVKIYKEDNSTKIDVNMEGLDKKTMKDIEEFINSALLLLQEKSIAEVMCSQNKKHIVIRITKSKFLM